MRSGPGRMTRVLCSAVLSFEALLMLLSILVLNGFSFLSVSAAATIGGAMAAACLVAAGSLGRPWGYGFAHVLQLAIVGLGLLAVPIFFMGLVFAGLWVVAFAIGLRIDHDRAIR